MTFLTRQAFAKQFGESPDDLDMHVIYDVSHNIAKVRSHLRRLGALKPQAMVPPFIVLVHMQDDVGGVRVRGSRALCCVGLVTVGGAAHDRRQAQDPPRAS